MDSISVDSTIRDKYLVVKYFGENPDIFFFFPHWILARKKMEETWVSIAVIG